MTALPWLPVATLAVALMLSLPVSAGPCPPPAQDVLEVPLVAGAPPGALRHELQAGGAVHIVDAPPVGAGFRILPYFGFTMCQDDDCLAFPNFDVAWFGPDDAVLAVHDDVGNEEMGLVPDGTDYGLVYFRTVPYVATLPPVQNGFHLVYHDC